MTGDKKGREPSLNPQGRVGGPQVEGVHPGWVLRCLPLTTLPGSREIPGAQCCAANLMDTGFKLGSSVSHQAVPRKTLLCC